MSQPLTPRVVLERIEGWSGASIEELDGGLTNRSFLVTSGTKRGVLKIDHEPRGKPFNSRSAEMQIQATAHEAGLAPAVLFCNERCLFTQYQEGVVLSPERMKSPDMLERLGRTLRKLHALPRCGRTFDARGAARIYADAIDDRHSADVRRRIEVIDAMPVPSELRLCHNDLVAENIVDTGELMFLDWEYACDHDPLFDLATLLAHHEFDEAQTDALLTAYFDGEWQTCRSELKRQVTHYNALLWLWTAARS